MGWFVLDSKNVRCAFVGQKIMTILRKVHSRAFLGPNLTRSQLLQVTEHAFDSLTASCLCETSIARGTTPRATLRLHIPSHRALCAPRHCHLLPALFGPAKKRNAHRAKIGVIDKTGLAHAAALLNNGHCQRLVMSESVLLVNAVHDAWHRGRSSHEEHCHQHTPLHMPLPP